MIVIAKIFKIFEKIITSEIGDVSPGHVVTFVNPYSIFILARQDTALIESFDKIYSDGFLLCSLLRLFNVADVKRRSMDLTSIVVDLCNDPTIRNVGLIGAAESELHVATSKLNQISTVTFKAISHGYHDFSRLKNFNDVVAKIKSERVDLLLIGLGPGKQEKLAIELGERLANVSCYTCGGFISQTARTDKASYYPEFIDRWNLRWAFRFINEPHTRVRYTYILPFIFVVCLYSLSSRLKRVN